MPKPEIKYLLWLDLETTGLDTTADVPLELACLVTDMELRPVKNHEWEYEVLFSSDGWAAIRLAENEYVTNMHTENGLLAAIKQGHPKTIQGAENELLAMIAALPWGIDEAIALAGTGVAAYDMRVLENWMPRLAEFLDYRTFDIGHMRRFLSDIVGLSDDQMPPKADDEHRAMGDVHNALEQAAGMKHLFREAFEALADRDEFRNGD